MPFDHLTPEMALEIYRLGAFPMADSADEEEFEIFEAKQRALLPFENLHVSKSLRKKILKHEFDIRVNTAFEQVISACGEARRSTNQTWINKPIRDCFNELHVMGHAHSVECWQNDKLVGGLYGLQIGAAFCGESMFSRATDASKIALVHLCARLKATGFTLLDAQLPNPHLEQFGQILVEQTEYMNCLEKALKTNPDFADTGRSETDLIHSYLNKHEIQ